MWTELINNIESDKEIKYKLSYLSTLINVHGINLENEKDITLVKSKIKEFCTNATQRTGGLLLLYAVVHCSSSVYIENWSQIVLGSLQISDSLISREIPLQIINKMLQNFAGDSDYSEVFARVIPEVLPALLNPENDKIYKLSCQTLAFCMRLVPEIAATRVGDIESLLLKELDNPYGEIVEATGECFAALPYCFFRLQRRDSSTIPLEQIWCNLFTKILNTIHLLLNEFLKLTEDQEEYVVVRDLPVFDIPLEKIKNIPLSLIDVIKSFCQCMAKMMSSDNYSVSLPIKELLDTLKRIYKTEEIMAARHPNNEHLKLGYSQLVNGANIVLEALILNFPTFIEQNSNFVALINIALDSMAEIAFSQSSVSQVRGSTWKLINTWLNQYGSKGSLHLATDQRIVEEILLDIDIVEETQNKRSKQLKTSKTEEINQKANRIFVCTHALKALKNIFELNNNYMDKKFLDDLSSKILKISKCVVQNTSSSSVPYADEKCRKLLYDLLLSCTIYNDSLHNKYYMEAQSVIAASKDTSTKVRRICHKFRKLGRYYLNPRKPPPDAVQYSHPSMLERVQPPVIESVRTEWGDGIDWSQADGASSDEQMDEGEAAQVREQNASYSDKMDGEGDLMTVDEMDDNESEMNHGYRRVAKQSSQSVCEDESGDDSDIEPTYVSTDSNPHRVAMNDSSHVNSYGMQPHVEQYASESARTESHASQEALPSVSNDVENNVEEQVSSFVEVKSAAQKSMPQQQSPMGNGEWKKKEIAVESDEEDSDEEDEGDEEGEVKEEEGDEEGEANEELSDAAADEASDGKRSPDLDEERPSKRQKCVDEEADEDADEEVEEEDNPVNNQSSDEEENEVNNLPTVEQNEEGHTENLIDESQNGIEDNGCRSPTIKEMCGDFVLAEPATTEIS